MPIGYIEECETIETYKGMHTTSQIKVSLVLVC